MRRPASKFKPAPPGASAPVAARPPARPWLLALLLGLATIALYWPATRCDFINYDDDVYVTSNAHVVHGLNPADMKWAFIKTVDANWHPLTMLSHMLDCQLSGLNPEWHHLTNVLLHAANTVLIFVLLRGLTGAPWRSLFAAAFFGLHPLHVESVAWVSERKDVLSTFFGLLSLIYYAKYALLKSGNPDTNAGAGRKAESGNYLLSLIFLALGLMSKPMLVTWPFVFLLLDYWPLKRIARCGNEIEHGGRRDSNHVSSVGHLLLEKIPFFVMAAAASVLTFVIQKQSAAVITVEHLPLGARFGNALVSYCRYVGKLFWPADLAVFYPHPGYWPLSAVLGAGVILAGITIIAWLMRRGWPFMLMGWLWFCGTLLPVIGLVQAGQQAMADRYAYIPSLGLFIAVIWGAYELIRRRRYQVLALSAAGVAGLIICSGLTWRQLGYWHNSETLMRHALAVTKNNYVAHNNLGAVLDQRGQFDDAIVQFQEAIRINPDSAGSYNDYGNALEKKGRLDEAISQFQEAIRLDPDYANAYNNLGTVFFDKGQYDEAIRQYQQAIRLNPDFAKACYNLGNALGGKGELDEAVRQYQTAIRLDPYDTQARVNLGNVLERMGQADEAIRQYQEAIRLNPDAGIYNNLGNALEKQGQLDAAIAQFQEAIRLNPDYADAHNNLGTIFLNKGQLDEAIAQFRDAIRLNPKYAQAYNNLGAALGNKGHLDEAIQQFREAVRLNPDDPEARNNLESALQMKNAPAVR